MAEARTDTGMSDDLITCPICFAIFELPKSLPCLHTFCKDCLHTYISKAVQENKPKVECPTCRSSVGDFTGQDINQWIESLPTNFIVNSLIERDNIQTGRRNCEVCEHLGKSSPATKWCQECSEAYCDECSQGHSVHKILRKHNLISIKDALKGIYSATNESFLDCSIHKNRKIELFCFDHEQPCCLTCMTIHHRKCDRVTTLEEAAENFRNEPTFISFTKRMNVLTLEMREGLSRLDETKKKFSSQLFQVKEKARTKKEDMVKHIETLYKKIENDIKAVEKQQEADDQSEIMTQKIIQLELVTKTLETLKETTSDLNLFLEFHKMKGKKKDFEGFLEHYRSNKKQKSVKFTFHKNVTKFDSVISCLGEVSVVDCLEQAQESKSATVDYTSSHLKEVLTIKEEGVRFMDAVCIATGTILAVDDTQKAIWAYDDTGTVLSRSDLPCDPWTLAVVDGNKVVVTLRQHKSLQFLTYEERSKTFSKGKTIKLNEEPYGVEYADNCLYVTCAKKVRKLTLNGRIVNELVIPESSLLFGISHFNGNVMIGDRSNNATHSIHVITMDSEPLVKCKKKHSELDGPLGVTTDREGNIYVAGYTSNNVIQLSRCGELMREILPSSSGFKNLIGINFSYDGSKFILTHENKITLFEFQ